MRLINWSERNELNNKKFSFVNLYSYILLRNRADLSAIDYMSDGFFICILAKLFGKKLERFSFDMTSLAPTVFVEFKNRRFGFVGSSADNIKAFSNFIDERFSVVPVFAESGYFDNSLADDVCNSIIESGAEVVIIGLGTPLQEEFMIRLFSSGYNGLAFTCGGFITQTANANGEYYPKLVNNLNLRFLYRMFKEPHTIKRYLFLYPKGAILFIYDCLLGRNSFGSDYS